jgi:hypothetical protein
MAVEQQSGSYGPQPDRLGDLFLAAHKVVHDLLRTEVTAYDVVTAVEKQCVGWTEEDQTTVLRLAQEFAQIEGCALVKNMDASRERADGSDDSPLLRGLRAWRLSRSAGRLREERRGTRTGLPRPVHPISAPSGRLMLFNVAPREQRRPNRHVRRREAAGETLIALSLP